MEEFMASSATDLHYFVQLANWLKNMYVLQSSFIDWEASEKDSFSN